MTLKQGHSRGTDWLTFICLQDKTKPIIQSIQHLTAIITLTMLITWLGFGGMMYFLRIFFKIADAFFKVKYYLPYIRNNWIDWQEPERKCIGWILDQLREELWPHPWHWSGIFSRSQLETAELIFGLIDVKWKGNSSIGYWAIMCHCPFVIPITLALNFQINFEITQPPKWEGRLTWDERDANRSFMSMSVTTLGWPWWGGCMHGTVTGRHQAIT